MGGGGLIYVLFAARYKETNFRKIAETASFRGSLVQVGEYAESIAFNRAANHEHHWAILRLQKLVSTLWGVGNVERGVQTGFTFLMRGFEGVSYFVLARHFLRPLTEEATFSL